MISRLVLPWLAFTALGLSLTSASRAETEPPELKLTLAPALVSDYMYRGTRLSGPSFQPAITASLGNASLGLWANLPIARKVPGQSDPELDLSGSWSMPLGDGAALVPGFTAYAYPRAQPANGFYRYTFEPNLALVLNHEGFTFTPKVYYDVVLQGPTWEATIARTFALTTPKLDLTLNATAGTFCLRDAVNRAPVRVRNEGDYWSAGISLTRALSPDSTLSLGWMLTAGRDNFFESAGLRAPNTLAGQRGVLTLVWSWTR